MLGRNKIRVEIIGGAFPEKKKCEVQGNQIILQPGVKGRGGAPITAEYDNTCLVPYYYGIPPFRSIKYKLMLRHGATKCVSFGKAATDVAPSCQLSDVSKYGQATVIKLAGALKPENRTFIYILLIINILISLFALLAATGKIRL